MPARCVLLVEPQRVRLEEQTLRLEPQRVRLEEQTLRLERQRVCPSNTTWMFACAGGQGVAKEPPAAAAPVDTSSAPIDAPRTSAEKPPASTTSAASRSSAPSRAEKILAALKRLYGSCDDDPGKVAAFYASDAIVKVPGIPDTVGRDAIAAQFARDCAAAPDTRSALRRIWIKDDVAVVEWTMTGTHTGPAAWGKATGRAFGFNGASVTRFDEDGLVKEDHGYSDMLTLFGQLGVRVTGLANPLSHPIATLPAGPPEIHIAKGTATEDADVASARALNRAVEKGDAKACVDALTDDSVYEDVTMLGPMKGKKSAEAFYKDFFKAFPKPKISEGALFGIEDFTLDEWTMAATQKSALAMGPGIPLPNTQKTIDFHTLEILQWRAGKLAHGWSYSNGLEMGIQLGLVPATKPGMAIRSTAEP
ncbi:MAG TPA: ester cyclase [Polyangiaceae bacterium]